MQTTFSCYVPTSWFICFKKIKKSAKNIQICLQFLLQLFQFGRLENDPIVLTNFLVPTRLSKSKLTPPARLWLVQVSAFEVFVFGFRPSKNSNLQKFREINFLKYITCCCSLFASLALFLASCAACFLLIFAISKSRQNQLRRLAESNCSRYQIRNFANWK